jgi:preprotein translocase subunit SecG
MVVFLGTLFIVICLLLMVVILLQKGRGGGLGAAFGGAGSSAFGTRTGDVFTWVTIVLTGLFLLLAVVNVLVFRPPPQTVAQPELTAVASSGGASVSMFAATKNAIIHYTVDGGPPAEQSPKYEKTAVVIKAGQQIKARAFRHGWKPSPIAIYGGEAATAPSEAIPATRPTTSPATAPTTPKS